MSAWIAVGLNVVTVLLMVGIFVGMIRGRLETISTGQDHLSQTVESGQSRLEKAIGDLGREVAVLTTADAVNTRNHEDVMRRVGAIEAELRQQGDRINAMRIQVHMHSSKLQSIDPSWEPYRPTLREGGD